MATRGAASFTHPTRAWLLVATVPGLRSARRKAGGEEMAAWG